MPPLPPSPATVRVRLNGLTQGAPWNAIHHWQYTGTAPTAAQLATLATDWKNAWGTAMNAVHGGSVSLTSVEAWDIASDLGAYGISTGAAVVGTRAGLTLPVSIACVTTWKVTMRWKGGHPRTYWPAGMQGDVASGRSWITTFQSAMLTSSTAYLTAINGLTSGGLSGKLVTLRRQYTDVNGTVQSFIPPRVLLITAAEVDSRLDSQRRRLGPDVKA